MKRISSLLESPSQSKTNKARSILTPGNMEWRIFVPCRLSSEMEKTPSLQPHSPEAEILLTDILTTIYAMRPTGVPIEKRSDVYIVGNKFFGLKYRSSEKLELKTLQRSTDLGIEEYKKLKFGKKSLKKYEEDILEELHRYGYHDDVLYRSLLQAGQTIEVNKTRCNIVLGAITLEVVDIELVIPCNAPRHWCSIAVEAETAMDIQSFVASNALLRRVLADIQSLIHLSECHNELSVVLPILGGYPIFVQYVHGDCNQTLAKETFTSLFAKLF